MVEGYQDQLRRIYGNGSDGVENSAEGKEEARRRLADQLGRPHKNVHRNGDYFEQGECAGEDERSQLPPDVVIERLSLKPRRFSVKRSGSEDDER